MEKMRLELLGEGLDVAFLAVNVTSGVDTQQNLVNVCSFPLFQDEAGVGAWALHGGAKDDLIVYAADGTLSAFLPYGGSVNTSLGTPEGYGNLKAAILDALAQ